MAPGIISSGNGQGVLQSGAKASLPATNSIVETPSDTFLLDFNKDIVDQILPFDSLYQLAVKNSPVLKFERANGEAEKANYNFSKIVVLKNVYPFLNYSNGTQSLASNGTLVSDLSQIINGYRYGINVQIPFDELIGRKSKMRQAAATYRAVVARREIEELNLKREMIKVYQDMLTSQRILRVRYRDEQTSGMAFQVAEVELKQGKIEPRELAQISNFYAQAKSATEYQSGEFLKHFYDLQALIGVPIQYLQMSTKVVPILPQSEQMPVNVLPSSSKPELKKSESKKKP
ncbi:TolC family protein [Spirosoma validum]|uniref:TolC family protein n=1 Tax=Spirosoma validum TaxID=2771355 RepID=A0A927B6J5_9BACT|nr:TolC family protein [Spirosoma validum]MBD2756223.1 TolC family protein [Spirosoma validum]